MFTFTTTAQPQRTSGQLISTMLDEHEAPVVLADISSLRLTLYDVTTRTILNSRQNQNVLNTNNVTVGATNGLVTWAVQPADMDAVTSLNEETHCALFTVRWSAGAKERSWQILLPVSKLTNYV